MELEKKQYLRDQAEKLTQAWMSISAIFGALFFMSLSALDYYVTPENFRRFLIYRITISLFLCLLYLLNKLKRKLYYQYLLIICGIISSAIIIELMILHFEGHKSLYYAGLNLLIVCVLGVLPLNLSVSLGLSLSLYFIYLFPILIYDQIIDLRFFINSNVFIISTIAVAFAWRTLNQRSYVNELSLQYDLNKEKQKLETYSTQLEQLVQERTKELAISEKWHRSIFDNATDGIMVLDKTGKIINVNQKACEIHGFDKNALIGSDVSLLEAKADRENYDERMSRILNGESLIYETEHYQKDGNKVLLEVSSKAIDIEGETYIQSFYRDITEKKRIQEQLMHSQKMESVGSLAGGIAHNFNNILTAILGYAELLLEFSELDDTSKQRVRYIESSARKAGVMVSKLLSFARREPHEVLPLNLNDVINDSVKLIEGVLDKKIGLKVDLNSNIPVIEGDPNQLEQVMMNLMVNARDAMPDGGLITIKTRLIEVGGNRHNLPDYVAPGRYVVLTISDTGSGIPKPVIDRIFDPFFTTKEKGKGTGLGLASVYGIVKDHKGYISVQSEIDKGTSFDVYLPASGKTAHKIAKPQIISVEGNENILLIDDDREVLNLIKDVLETHGYHVMPASNSLSAIDVFKDNADKIQLVITDIVMPLMEGNELITILKDIKPSIKTVVISGYSDEAINKGDIDFFLKKPFEGIELLRTVRRILDRGIRKLPLY